MSLMSPGDLANQEPKLSTSTHRNIFFSLILILVLTALLLYNFVRHVKTKRVGSNSKAFDFF